MSFEFDGAGGARNKQWSSFACDECKHLLGYRRCDAFPAKNGIPFEIWAIEPDEENPHLKPYRGDHGIQFEPR